MDDDEYADIAAAANQCSTVAVYYGLAGGGWQMVSIPLADFFDDNSFLFGGNGVLDTDPVSRGGNGGLIAIDRAGNIAMPLNSRGMYRGYRLPGQEPVVYDFFTTAPGLGADSRPPETLDFHAVDGQGHHWPTLTAEQRRVRTDRQEWLHIGLLK